MHTNKPEKKLEEKKTAVGGKKRCVFRPVNKMDLCPWVSLWLIFQSCKSNVVLQFYTPSLPSLFNVVRAG